MSRQRRIPSSHRTCGRWSRHLCRVDEREAAGRQVLKALAWAAGIGLVIAGCAPTLSCSPETGDSSARVIAECGQPLGRAEMRTSYGIRQEFEYADMLVVIDDGEVLTVLKDEVL